MKRTLMLAAALLGGGLLYAWGQNNFPAPGGQTVPLSVMGCLNGGGAAVPCSSVDKLPVDATVSVSASIEGFKPAKQYATVTATASSATVALPSGSTVVAYNTGTTAVSCILAVGAGTATANKDIIQPGSWMSFVPAVGDTDLACIDQTGTASNVVILSGGSGLPSGSGGGSSGVSGGASSSFDAAFPATGTAIGIWDGTNMKAWLAGIALVDGVNGNNTGAVAGYVWNGTTWDRMPGTTAGVKTTAASGAFASGSLAAGSMVDLLTVRGTKAAGTAAANSLLAGAVYSSTPPTLTDGQQAALQFDSAGNLKINVVAGGAGGGAVTISDGDDVTQGAKADAVCATATGTCTLTALVKYLNTAVTGAVPCLNATAATTNSYSNGQTNPANCDLHGGLYVTVTNTTTAIGNDSDAVATSSGGNSPVIGYGYVWNGTTWDRAPGSTTGATVKGSGAAGTAATGVVTVQGIASMTPILVTPAANSAVNVAQVGGAAVVADPCQANAKVYQPISQATSTQLFAGTSAKKTYVCSIVLIGADAENVSLISGTGTVCATDPAAMIGGTTAAAGPNLAANGGFSHGNGASAIAISAVNADNVCLLQSGSGRVAGVMTYVSQ